MDHIAISPFGARGLSPAMLAGQAIAEACPEPAKADKWAILRDLIEAKTAFALSDRAITVLSALLSFLPGTEMAGAMDLVVFPSNRELCRRAHGISEATLRRCLTLLVEARLIVRHDSPNGKRYARRSQEGTVERAFGFNLRPLLARVDDIALAAEAARRARREWLELRERVTLLRRDLAKSFEFVRSDEQDWAWSAAERQAWGALEDEAGPLMEQRTRGLAGEDLAEIAYRLGQLMAKVDKLMRNKEKEQKKTGSDAQDERHKQDSNQTPIFDSECLRKDEGGGSEQAMKHGALIDDRQSPAEISCAAADTPMQARPSATADGGNFARQVSEHAQPLHLDTILKACPDVAGFAAHGIASWDDLLGAAEKARIALGISPHAWREAREAMGPGGAAVTIATILQRVSAIQSPGGYLRSLTMRAGQGKFTPGPVVLSLLRQDRAILGELPPGKME